MRHHPYGRPLGLVRIPVPNRHSGFFSLVASFLALAVAGRPVHATPIPPPQLQAFARDIVVANCVGADTSSPSAFEADLYQKYPSLENGGTTPLEKAILFEAGELFRLAQCGVKPSEYAAKLATWDNLSGAPISYSGASAAPVSSTSGVIPIADTDQGYAAAPGNSSNYAALHAGRVPAKNVQHFFVWAGYQVANPFVFSPAGPATTNSSTTVVSGGTTTTTTQTTTTPPAAGTNGSIKPSTTYGGILEMEYLNRLAWDPLRIQRLDISNVGWLDPLDLKHWDIESHAFFSLGSPPSSSTTTAGGAQSSMSNISATALEGSGNFGVELALAQDCFVINPDPGNFQTIGIEERFSGVSDRTSYRNHAEWFAGFDYTIGSLITKDATEPLRFNVRAGLDELDTVSFVSPTSTSSQSVYTENGAPVFSQKLYGSIQSEALIPLGNNAFLVVGGRIYLGPTRPAPWTSYIGYSFDISSIAKAFGAPGKSSKSTTMVQPSD